LKGIPMNDRPSNSGQATHQRGGYSVAKTAVITALSKREEEIARLVASGLSNSEVAQRLSISESTVTNYLARAYEKLGISTPIELLFYIFSRYQGTESEQNLEELLRAIEERARRRDRRPASPDEP
jgi:DNA-binding NarL/FixJ family response regulator